VEVGDGRWAVRAEAPVRICDLGGWTDTWFAGRGRVCNIAAGPGVVVEVALWPRSGTRPPVEVHAASFGDRYGYDPADGLPGRHPLLEAAIAEVGLPAGSAATVAVHSAVPPGSSTGTSASVTVALVGALLALRSPGDVPPAEAARLAHRVETVRLGRQSGIQDHLAAAHGAISDIRMERYPDAEVAAVDLGPDGWRALRERLAVVYLGRAHDSSAVHGEVIAALEGAAPAVVDARLAPLRHAAADGAEALRRGDLDGLGAAMVANTRAQEALHPDLVGAAARRVIEVAAARGAVACKVNGAGGDGGSVTILAGSVPVEEVLQAIEAGDARFRRLDLHPVGHGLRVARGPAA
jgi:D-glycero-alpha-D-manno-heptose-7-phosphate kinase